MADRQPKLFMVSNMYPSHQLPRFGIFVRNFEERLQTRGVAIPYKKVLTNTKNIDIVTKTSKYFSFLLSILVHGYTQKKHYNLVYVHYPVHSAIPVLVLTLLTNKPVVINFHGNDLTIDSLIKQLLRPFLLRLAQRSKAIVVPSVYYKQQVTDALKVQNEKIIVYPSGGIDTSLFQQYQNSKRQETRKKLNLSEEDYLLGYISTFKPSKGWRVFLDGVEGVLKERDNCSAIMVGDGPDRDAVEAFIQNKGLQHKVKIIKSVSQHQLVDYYNALDGFVFPTLRKDESLGLVALEAMACGVPVIASNYAAPKDYIMEKENGLLFEMGNSDDLAAKLHEFLAFDEQKLRRMSKGARETALSYDAQKVNDDMADKLKSWSHPKK